MGMEKEWNLNGNSQNLLQAIKVALLLNKFYKLCELCQSVITDILKMAIFCIRDLTSE